MFVGSSVTQKLGKAGGTDIQRILAFLARFVREQGLSDKDSIVVETASGVITLYQEANELVRVNMGVPNFAPASLPFLVSEEQNIYELAVADQTLRAGAVSMGNPHLVLQVEDLARAPVAEWGPLLEAHPLFPERVNVGFMQCIDKQRIHLRVYERGAAETLACGTGACAAVAVGRRWGLLDEQVTVSLPGGELEIRWAGEGQPLWMIGPATTVFEGVIEA